MGIADSIVNLAFGLTLGAVAIAFALAFGSRWRQPAERVLTDLLDKAKKEGTQPNPLYQAKAESTQSTQGKEEHASLKEQMDTPTVQRNINMQMIFQLAAEVDPGA